MLAMIESPNIITYLLVMKLHKTLLPQIIIFFFTTFGSLNAEELVIWISSFQDQVYYEQMGELYTKTTKKDVTINVKAYGFREMPDKLGVAIRSGREFPTWFSWMKLFLVYF